MTTESSDLLLIRRETRRISSPVPTGSINVARPAAWKIEGDRLYLMSASGSDPTPANWVTTELVVPIRGPVNVHYTVVDGAVTRARLLRYITAGEYMTAVSGSTWVHHTRRDPERERNAKPTDADALLEGLRVIAQEARLAQQQRERRALRDAERQARRARIVKRFPWLGRWLG